MQEERKLQMQQQSEGKTFIKTSRGERDYSNYNYLLRQAQQW